jgi:hypothetical protein
LKSSVFQGEAPLLRAWVRSEMSLGLLVRRQGNRFEGIAKNRSSSREARPPPVKLS